MDLYTIMKDFAGSDDPAKGAEINDGDIINGFPTQNVMLPVDSTLVRKNGTVNANDPIVDAVRFKISKNYIYKNDAAILNIIAANKWKRPICFTSPYGELGFDRYLRQDGLTYRLVPIDNGGATQVNADWIVETMLNKYSFGNAQTPGVYYDEENRRHLNSIRLAFAQAAGSLADMGRKEDAKKLLNRCDSMLNTANLPYGMPGRYQQHNQISMQMVYASYRAGENKLAEKISGQLKKDMEQQQAYFMSLPEKYQNSLTPEMERIDNFLKGLMQMEQQFKMMNQNIPEPAPVKVVPQTDTAKP
jgi:hypothetical protein